MTTENKKPEVKEIDINEIVEIVTPFDELKVYEPLLKEIQGNILKSHGRNHAVYLFLKFKKHEKDKEEAKKDIEKTKQWIGSFSHKYVTSALEQAKQGKRYRQNQEVPGKDVPAKVFASFFLTRAGYMHLGYTYAQLPNEDAFRQGMQDANMQNELGDDSNQWDDGFKNNQFHALVLLAADKAVGSRTDELKRLEQKEPNRLRDLPFLLEETLEDVKKELRHITEVIHEEKGYVLRDENLEEIEHFGFRDGVSQPLFLKRDIYKEREPEHTSGFDKWDPRAPLSLVLFKDPLGDPEKESYGSFLVFRKLEENVGGWNRDVVNLARKLGIVTQPSVVKDEQGKILKCDFEGKQLQEPLRNKNPLDRNSPPETLPEWRERLNLTPQQTQQVKLVEGYTMGRIHDGQPTVLSPNPKAPKEHVDNNFNYAGDPQGSKCPFFAHIRKVNPRGDTGNESLVATPVPLEEEKMHRIVRRGISYGKLPSEVPEKDAGLLFMCFQASLVKQFNFMQKAWAKQSNFVKRDVGTDVVIGVEIKEQVPPNEHLTSIAETYKFPNEWGSQETTEVDFKHWVTMRGGEFFFAPSMSFLKALAPKAGRNRETRDDVVFRGVPIEEIEAGKQIIMELLTYKENDWAIGLHGDTLQPDKFLTFFNQRELPFKFYLLNQVGLGDSKAYQENIKTLAQYLEDAINQEIEASEYKITELKEYKRLCWDIGVYWRVVYCSTGEIEKEGWETDTLANFFGERGELELPFKFYVQSKDIKLGNSNAYEENIATLETYIERLKRNLTTGIFDLATIIPVRLVSKVVSSPGGKDLVLSVFDESTDDSNVVVSQCKQDGKLQLWLLKAAEDGYYYLEAQDSKMVLHVTNDPGDRGNVIARKYQGSENQKWKFNRDQDGYYYLEAKLNVLNKKVKLHVAARRAGADVIASSEESTDFQKWNIEFI